MINVVVGVLGVFNLLMVFKFISLMDNVNLEASDAVAQLQLYGLKAVLFSVLSVGCYAIAFLYKREKNVGRSTTDTDSIVS